MQIKKPFEILEFLFDLLRAVDVNKKEKISKAKWIILAKLEKHIFVFKSSIFIKLSKNIKIVKYHRG